MRAILRYNKGLFSNEFARSMQEKRLTHRLHHYWHHACGDAPYPDIKQFNPAAIEDVWPFCFIVNIFAKKPRLLYQYNAMGEEICGLYGADVVGELVKENPAEFPGRALYKMFHQVVEECEHLHTGGNFLTRENRMAKYRACLLPLGNKKKGVTHILVGLSYRVF